MGKKSRRSRKNAVGGGGAPGEPGRDARPAANDLPSADAEGGQRAAAGDAGEEEDDEEFQRMFLRQMEVEREEKARDAAERDEVAVALSELEGACAAGRERIQIRSRGLSDADMTRIVASLRGNSGLRRLGISAGTMTVGTMRILSGWIAECRHLDALSLRRNQIFDDELLPLAAALKTNASLKSVDLSHNNFDARGARALANALRANTVLETLILHDNYLYNDSAKEIANALRVNKTLRHLSLTRNGVEEEGYISLASALKKNTTLRKLDLHYYEFGEEGRALMDAVDRNARRED